MHAPGTGFGAGPRDGDGDGAGGGGVWGAALDTAARPVSVASTSAASCVTTVSPAPYLRALLARLSRNLAPSPAVSSRHASSTRTSCGRSGEELDTWRQIASNASSVPTGFSSSASSLMA